MNLLVITDYAATYEGNFIQSLKSLEQKNKGKTIYLFPNKAKEFHWVQQFEKKHKVYYFTSETKDIVKRISLVVKNENVSIMYSHFALFKTQKAIKIVKILNKDVKLVQHFHNHYFNVKNPLYKWCFNGDLNIGCSKSVGDSLPYHNSTYVDNAIDFERLKEFDENFEFPQKDKYQITMFGFDYKRKGVDIAIKAIEPIVEKLNLHLNIVISVGKDDIKNSIIQDFEKIPSWISLMDARNDIATYLNKSDMFILAAREEGFCYALIEAGYCGCSLISSKIPGVPYHVPGCRVFESENDLELSKVIENIVLKKNDFDNTETKNYILKNYHVDLWSDKIYQKLQNLI